MSDSVSLTGTTSKLEEQNYSSSATTTGVHGESASFDVDEKKAGSDIGKLVVLEDEDDPKKMGLVRKWCIVLIISTASLCVTCGSSTVAFTEPGMERDFHISHEVAILSISLYVVGLGIGPLFMGPLSEFYGRRIVYNVSYSIFWLFGFPIAFANNAPVFLLFRFLQGLAGAAFLSVTGGSVSDLFDNFTVANPMAVYTTSPFLGPVVGPAFAGFINQHTNWRWTYYVLQIWTFVEVAALVLFVPETYVPTILQRKARRLRKATGDDEIYAPLDRNTRGVFESILVSCYRPFEIIIRERMALLLDLWGSLLLGILYLSFEAFPIIFGGVHHFDVQMIGLTFIGIGLGMLIALATQPFWNKVFMEQVRKHGGSPPPEVRLFIGMAGAILVPISLFWMAFTTYPQVHWVVPIIASIPLGTGILYSFTSIFTFLVTAYRPNAASAMAGNSFMRSSFAAAFPLFTGPMYARLGTVGATAMLAGLTVLMAPLPFIFYKYGARLRQHSRFTG